jgi:hypothetical protein
MNGTHQLLVYADDVNMLGKIILPVVLHGWEGVDWIHVA